MALLTDIDPTKPVMVAGYVMKNTDDPMFIELSEQLGMPELLRCTEPVTDALVEFTGADVSRVLAEMSAPAWREHFERDLQCVAEDAAGKPILTTWMPTAEFQRFLADVSPNSPFASLRSLSQSWAAKGVTTIYVDGYRLA